MWALPTCKPAGSTVGGSIPLESSRLANNKAAQGPSNVYLYDRETVDLIPQGIEGPNVIYQGVSITAPPAEGTPVPTIPVGSVVSGERTAPSGSSTTGAAATGATQPAGDRTTQQQAAAPAPAKPAVTQEASAKTVVGGSAGKPPGCAGNSAAAGCNSGPVLAAAKDRRRI